MAGGIFRDVHGQLIAVAEPSAVQDAAIESYREQCNTTLSADKVLERIRRHTALIAEARVSRG